MKHNINDDTQDKIGPVFNKVECIQLCLDLRPDSDIAAIDVGDSGGNCYCRYGREMTEDSSADIENCLLTTLESGKCLFTETLAIFVLYCTVCNV